MGHVKMARHIVDDKSKGIVNLMITQLYLAIVRMALPGLLQGNKLGCLKKLLSTKNKQITFKQIKNKCYEICNNIDNRLLKLNSLFTYLPFTRILDPNIKP